MTSFFDWDTAIGAFAAHLAGLGKLPPPLSQHPALQAIAAISLSATIGIEHRLTPDSTIPDLSVRDISGHHYLVDQLLDSLAHDLAAPCRGRFHYAFCPGDWIAQHQLDELVLRSVHHTADDSGRANLFAHTGQILAQFNAEQDRLRRHHMRALFERDLPGLEIEWTYSNPDSLTWLLAPQFHGDATRATRVQRRLQAFSLYGSLADYLREQPITEIIDAGAELVPALTERLALTPAQLRSLRDAAPPAILIRHDHPKFDRAVRHLQAHDVPLPQWPGAGRPGQHEAWRSSPWLTSNEFTPIPADYYARDPTTVRDAVRGFTQDLIAPLAVKLRLASYKADNLFASLGGILHSDTLTADHLAAVRQFVAAIRRALIGMRGPKAFQQAAHLWHRRAAAVAALRHEHQTDRPGWPPLCPPWTSACGHYRIVPLTSAQALVDEGNAHHHCVGTYYDDCRSGRTQILSLRKGDTPIVTAEILLDEEISSIRVGQFKGLYNAVPEEPVLHQTMRDFLRDLRSGAHPLERQQLRAYRQAADRHSYGYRRHALTLHHARRAFPLYRSLLPRTAPAEFDAWCAANNLKRALRAVLPLLEADPGEIVF